jgi:uncharacterized DUF497 family protein
MLTALIFEWDRRKASQNQRKHGVTFDEARTALLGENARLIRDPEHFDGEDRFVLLALSTRARLFVVCHCYRHADGVTRIISARKADKSERRQYAGFLP